jgi:apolipoprotein N-acyltransferase
MAERFLSKVDGIATHAAVTIGIAAWITTSALLASPWAAFAPRGRSAPTNFLHAVLATLAVTLPPLGLIGWLSPLHVSGALFPGWGIAGLGLGLLVTGLAATTGNPRCRLALGSLLVTGAIVNYGYTGSTAVNCSFRRRNVVSVQNYLYPASPACPEKRAITRLQDIIRKGT